jgi:aryl-alcohol dehydrogenase-like predicted oxidoreductase
MQTTTLGRTGLPVSRLCLGTMNFGPHTTEADSFAIMDAALDKGLNFFDTADVYGWVKGEGVTEQIIGRWLAQGGQRRERVILATKVFGPMERENQANPIMGRGLSARKIRQGCEDSLRRLQTDYIDLYQMHHIAREAPWDEVWQAMETLVQQGKVVYVGSSNFAGWHLATACQTAAKRNFLGLVCEQSKYSLFTRDIELEVVPACRAYGLGLIPWSPLAGGYLAGALGTYTEGRRAKGKGFGEFVEKHRDQLQKYEDLCRSIGQPPASVAIAWLLANPVVTAPIIGPRTLEQLDGMIATLDVKLDEDTLRKLDAIFPGPGGEAPEAYAW